MFQEGDLMLGKKLTTRTGLGLFALLALLVFGPGLLTTADEAVEATETPEAVSDTASSETGATTPSLTEVPVHGALGMVVVIDEETGKMRAPTSYEMDDMTSQHEQYWLDGSELETIKGPGNSVMLKLDSRFHKFAVAEVPTAGQASVHHDVALIPSETLLTGDQSTQKEDATDVEEPTESAEEVAP